MRFSFFFHIYAGDSMLCLQIPPIFGCFLTSFLTSYINVIIFFPDSGILAVFLDIFLTSNSRSEVGVVFFPLFCCFFYTFQVRSVNFYGISLKGFFG